MDISILFNWPPAQDSARVSFGGPTIDDMEYEFRVGVIKKDEQNKIYWLKPGWVHAPDIHQIKFDVKTGEKIVVEKKRKGDEKITTRNIWDIEKEWPEKAAGGASVNVPWTFY